MNNKLKGYRVLAQAAFTLTCLFGATTSSCAQDGAKLASEKWRPKDGVYASPGKDFVASCEESAWRASYCPDEQQRIYRGKRYSLGIHGTASTRALVIILTSAF